MTDIHLYMLFGAGVTLAGFVLARTSQVGTGQTTIRIFGGEFSLAAAGGIVVMLLGIIAFALPMLWGAGAEGTQHTPPVVTDMTGDRAEIGNDAGAVTDNLVELGAGDTPPAPTADATPMLKLMSERQAGADRGRADNGWLKDAPTYYYDVETGKVGYVTTMKEAECQSRIAAYYTKKGVAVDYASGESILFSTGKYLISIWCHDGTVIYSVFGPFDDELIKVRDRVSSAIEAAVKE